MFYRIENFSTISWKYEIIVSYCPKKHSQGCDKSIETAQNIKQKEKSHVSTDCLQEVSWQWKISIKKKNWNSYFVLEHEGISSIWREVWNKMRNFWSTWIMYATEIIFTITSVQNNEQVSILPFSSIMWYFVANICWILKESYKYYWLIKTKRRISGRLKCVTYFQLFPV